MKKLILGLLSLAFALSSCLGGKHKKMAPEEVTCSPEPIQKVEVKHYRKW
jgi:hypothetical protein